MDSSVNFTVVIPTNNRHHYLDRSLDYFTDLNAPVEYYDSSIDAFRGAGPRHIKYHHVPGKSFVAKVLQALESISTNNVALCADDDFILHETLHHGAAILDSDPTFGTVVGKIIDFHDVFDGDFYIKPSELPRDLTADLVSNAQAFFRNYYNLLWAMHKKDILLESFQAINQACFHNDNFIEMIIGGIACARGNIKFIDKIWSVRELSSKQHWGDQNATIDNITTNKFLKNDFQKMKEVLDPRTFTGYSELIMKNYLRFSRPRTVRNIFVDAIKYIIPPEFLSYAKSHILQREYASSYEKYPDCVPYRVQKEPDGLQRIRNILISQNKCWKHE